MTGPKGQQEPGTRTVPGADAAKPAGSEPHDLDGDGARLTSTHYPDRQAGDAKKPGGRNGDGVSENRLGYHSTDRGSLPSTRDTTGGRIRKITDGS